MQFKHPEILYFLFLLLIPILVHLFQLRRFKKEYFTNVKFLQELTIQTRKSSQLKKWLLLFTRILLLGFLIIAFAQPFFKAKDSAGVQNEMVIVLDNSFSMQAKGKKGELLKRAVQDLLEILPENRTFSLLTNTESFWNTDIKSIQKELQQLDYTAVPFELESHIARIKAKDSRYRQDVVVITDKTGLKSSDTQFNNDDYINFYFNIRESEQKYNISIDSVFIHQILDGFYEIGVQLQAYGNTSSPVPVAIYNQGQLAAKTQATMENTVEILYFSIPKNNFHGYVTIEDNALPYDNNYYFSISQPQKWSVLAIGSEEKNGFLKRIYTGEEFILSQSKPSELNYNEIEKQSVVILNEIKDISQALQTTLRAFIEKGGTVILIPHKESDLTVLNDWLRSLGGIRFKTSSGTDKKITRIAFDHPLYQGVFEKRTDNFQYPQTKAFFELESPYAAILNYEDQSPFLTCYTNGSGNLYVLANPIETSVSNFQNAPLIVPTFYKMGQPNASSAALSFEVLSQTHLLLDLSLGKDDILHLVSGKDQWIPLQQVLNDKIRLTFDENPTRAGNYAIEKAGKPVKNVSFNYSRNESNTSVFDKSIFQNVTVAKSLEELLDTLESERTPYEIWKWFIAASLLFLFLEILIQKYIK